MLVQKSHQQLNEEAAARRELARQRLNRSNDIPADQVRQPRDRAELLHVQEIEHSAQTMRGAGYSCYEHGQSIIIEGPHARDWHESEADELREQRPPYAKLTDYVLAVHEQAVR